MIEPTYPGAVAPERTCTFASLGVQLRALEWGDPRAMPIVLAHGMWDHAHSFSVLGPLLAARFRVIALDARGHGDSTWASAYTWPTDVLDIVNVMRALGEPVHLVGHSKGGGQVTDAACIAPELVRKVVNIDGFGPPSLPTGDDPVPHMVAFLDARRRIAGRSTWRPYASLDDLVERRRAQNPRLTREWLRYFLFFGALESPDGWRWKHDPQMGHGFGPWRPEWIGPSYAALHAPMLAVVGSEHDTWGPLPEPLLSERLSHVKRLERRVVAGAGHFVHIEKPRETAALICEFLES